MEPEKKIRELGSLLRNQKAGMGERFRALFALRSLSGPQAVEEIGSAFGDPSALLKHELAFCLGQMGHRSAIPILCRTLETLHEDPMVRHEAGEALGAIGAQESTAILQRFAKDPAPEVAETCELALRRIEWANTGAEDRESTQTSPYETVDPTPAHEAVDVPSLERTLMDQGAPMWDRYRAMFALRNIGTDEAVLALAKGLRCPSSALLRHEVAYVLGQVQSPVAIKALSESLAKADENPMVRHEAAEALGSIGGSEVEVILASYAKDPSRVVVESVEVALDISDTATKPFSPLIAN